MAIPVGSKAPDFTLKSKQPSGLVDVKLSDNLGKKNTVLLFFPAAFTSVCTKEVIKQYNVVFPMLAGIGDTAARAAFVIDKNGVVQYSEQTPTPKDLPNFVKVKETLARLK